MLRPGKTDLPLETKQWLIMQSKRLPSEKNIEKKSSGEVQRVLLHHFPTAKSSWGHFRFVAFDDKASANRHFSGQNGFSPVLDQCITLLTCQCKNATLFLAQPRCVYVESCSYFTLEMLIKFFDRKPRGFVYNNLKSDHYGEEAGGKVTQFGSSSRKFKGENNCILSK